MSRIRLKPENTPSWFDVLRYRVSIGLPVCGRDDSRPSRDLVGAELVLDGLDKRLDLVPRFLDETSDLDIRRQLGWDKRLEQCLSLWVCEVGVGSREFSHDSLRARDQYAVA